MPETARYALISPTAKLEIRHQGPDQMLRDTAIGPDPPYEFTLISPSTGGHGLHACITSTKRTVAPPNPLAETIVTALGGPARHEWLGILGICGTKIDNPTGATQLCGLNSAQERLVQAIYTTARTRNLTPS